MKSRVDIPHSIKTPVGVVAGRDAIFLSAIEYPPVGMTLRLRGDFNPMLCPECINPAEWPPPAYDLLFSGVVAVRITELDLYGGPYPSSFGWLEHSSWIKSLAQVPGSGQKLKNNHVHYVVSTYDDIIEVVALDYTLSVTRDDVLLKQTDEC